MADCLESFEMQTVAKALLAGIAIADELVAFAIFKSIEQKGNTCIMIRRSCGSVELEPMLRRNVQAILFEPGWVLTGKLFCVADRLLYVRGLNENAGGERTCAGEKS